MIRSNTFFYCALTIMLSFYFLNQIEFDLESYKLGIYEFILFYKSLNQHSIQYFTIALSL